MFLARLVQGATVEPGRRTLLVAGGSGYAAAVLAELTGSVVALESDPALSAMAARYLDGLGLSGVVDVVTGPLAEGHPQGAPYDLILVGGAVETNLEALFAQVAPKGCLVCIETRSGTATRRTGKAMRFDRVDGEMSGRTLFDASVPVIQEFRAEPKFTF